MTLPVKLGDKTVRLRDDFQIGKVPPQDVSMEEAVLGACIIETFSYTKVKDLLEPEDFYKDKHKIIFNVIKTLDEENSKIDLLLITAKLRQEGKLEFIGGAYYLTELTTKVNQAAHIEEHAYIIKQHSLKRQLILLASNVHTDGYNELVDPFDSIDKINEELTHITKMNTPSEDESLSELVRKVVLDIEAVKRGDKSSVGIPTGFPNLDKVIGAWIPSDLIIIAARPGMGKSALAFKLANNLASMFKVPTAFFSLEMSNLSLTDRFISMTTQIYLGSIRFRKVEDNQLTQIIDQAGEKSNIPLYLADKCFSLQQIKSKIRRLVDEKEVKVVFIDYLQLIHATGKKFQSRENEISHISRDLKLLAKELDITIVPLSQLSRAVEARGGDKRPKLSDLRESGAIEQDADVVIFIYRPEYYGIKQDHTGEKLVSGYTEAIIAKNRNGPLAMAELLFHGYRTDFTNYDRNSFEEIVKTKKPPF